MRCQRKIHDSRRDTRTGRFDGTLMTRAAFRPLSSPSLEHDDLLRFKWWAGGRRRPNSDPEFSDLYRSATIFAYAREHFARRVHSNASETIAARHVGVGLRNTADYFSTACRFHIRNANVTSRIFIETNELCLTLLENSTGHR